MATLDALAPTLIAYINGAWPAHVVHAAAELGLADALAQGPSDSADLAARLRLHPIALRRLLRAMTSLNLCSERLDGRFELRPLGALLRTDREDSLAPWALTWGRFLAPPWMSLADCVRTGRPARLGDGAGDYSTLAHDPSRALLFNQGMATMTGRLVPDLIKACRLPPGSCIVDVGGGLGTLMAGYLRADPTASGILFDLDTAIAAAPATLRAAGVLDRCQCIAGSFFDEIPGGGNVYVLKSVLHDWTDEEAVKILSACARAMGNLSQLLVMERIAPPAMTTEPSHQACAAADMNLLVGFGGRVRREDEFRHLLIEAGLSPVACHPAGWAFHVIVATKAPTGQAHASHGI